MGTGPGSVCAGGRVRHAEKQTKILTAHTTPCRSGKQLSSSRSNIGRRVVDVRQMGNGKTDGPGPAEHPRPRSAAVSSDSKPERTSSSRSEAAGSPRAAERRACKRVPPHPTRTAHMRRRNRRTECSPRGSRSCWHSSTRTRRCRGPGTLRPPGYHFATRARRPNRRRRPLPVRAKLVGNRASPQRSLARSRSAVGLPARRALGRRDREGHPGRLAENAELRRRLAR